MTSLGLGSLLRMVRHHRFRCAVLSKVVSSVPRNLSKGHPAVADAVRFRRIDRHGDPDDATPRAVRDRRPSSSHRARLVGAVLTWTSFFAEAKRSSPREPDRETPVLVPEDPEVYQAERGRGSDVRTGRKVDQHVPPTPAASRLPPLLGQTMARTSTTLAGGRPCRRWSSARSAGRFSYGELVAEDRRWRPGWPAWARPSAWHWLEPRGVVFVQNATGELGRSGQHQPAYRGHQPRRAAAVGHRPCQRRGLQDRDDRADHHRVRGDCPELREDRSSRSGLVVLLAVWVVGDCSCWPSGRASCRPTIRSTSSTPHALGSEARPNHNQTR